MHARVPRWTTLLLCGVALGILLRVWRFALNWPLWWNEAFVVVNLAYRDYAGLLQPLAYRQVCPFGFLWIEKWVASVLGYSEWSLRLVPLLASLFGLVVFASAARRVLSERGAFAAVALLAVAYHPLRLGSEIKPYAIDLLAAALGLELATRWLLNPARRGRLVGMFVAAPILVCVSYPATLVLAGTVLALAPALWRRSSRVQRLGNLCGCIVMLAAVLAVYVVSAAGQARAARADQLNEYLRDGFPASWLPWHLAEWVAGLAFGRLFAFPFGDAGIASVIGCALAALGVWAWWKRAAGTLACLVMGPLLVSAAAAMLRVYPLGGHPRVSQHLMPAFALAMGCGIDVLARSVAWRPRRFSARWSALALAVAVGIIPLIRDMHVPYRTRRDLAAREFARTFWPKAARDATVVDLRSDGGLLDWDSSNPDVALYLANRTLFAPKGKGDPSSAHTTRYVLYYAPELEDVEWGDWLAGEASMGTIVSWSVSHIPAHEGRGGRIEVIEARAPAPPGMARADGLESSSKR